MMKQLRSLRHALAHFFLLHRGHVTSRTDEEGRIMIGFRCAGCGKVTREIDATMQVDREIDAHWNEREGNGPWKE